MMYEDSSFYLSNNFVSSKDLLTIICWLDVYSNVSLTSVKLLCRVLVMLTRK